MSTISDDVKSHFHTRIPLLTPFIIDELSNPVLELSIEKAISTLNSYRPKILKLNHKMDQEGYILLRAYINPFDTTSQEPFIEDYNIEVANEYIYSVPWTAESLLEDRVNRKYFNDLVTYNAAKIMANVRRSADLSNLPFDLKGDSLFSEYDGKLAELIDTLQNTVRNTL